MRTLFFSILFVLVTLSLNAQSFEVPSNVVLEKAEDYPKYEKDVVKAVDWLVNTPINVDQSKRKQVNAFLFQWLSGAPDVTISISGEVVTFMDCADCLMVFMGGWAKQALESGEKSDLSGNVAGVELVITFYEKNKGVLGKNKHIEKYIKLKNKGKLESTIESRIQ